jgi:hypothetical protein
MENSSRQLREIIDTLANIERSLARLHEDFKAFVRERNTRPAPTPKKLSSVA